MDDLERAILLISSPSAAADPALRSQAMAFLDSARSDPSAAVRLSLHRLSLPSSAAGVQFWCLQTLHDVVRHRLASLPPSDLPLLRSSLLSLDTDLPPNTPPFLKNKLAQTLAALVAAEYPHAFPHPFLHLLSFLPASSDPLVRLLAALDDDLIAPRSPPDSATRVKDAIRAQCAPQIARALFDIACGPDQSLAAGALDVTARLAAWIDIGLVANDAFVPLLFDLLLSSPDSLRSSAAGCLLAVLSKRMDPRPKLLLLQNLRVNRLFSDLDLVPKIASLVTGYAAEALDCYKRLSLDNVDGSSALELLEEALPLVFYVTQKSDEADSCNVLEFLSDYVASYPKEKQMVYLGQILEVIRSQICFDRRYRANLDVPDKIGREEEDQMNEHRKDLFALFRSVSRVAPDAVQVFIRNSLAGALASSEMNVEEVEAALTLFYQLGEAVGEEGIKVGTGMLGELVPMLLLAKFKCHSYRIVALVYLETVSRFMKFVLENTRYIPHVLTAFLDERGIQHPNLSVSRRASYLFMRAVKLLRSDLVPFVDTILQSIQDTIMRFTSLEWSSKELKCSASGDGSQTFEAIGLLIGMDGVSPEKQVEYLGTFINPLRQKVESLILDAKVHGLQESSAKVVSLQQIIMALTALSKGFNGRVVASTCPAIGIMFKQTLDVLLQVLVMFPNIKPLRNKLTSFLHRMVDILGASLLPYLPVVFDNLLAGNETKDMMEFILLVNQVISKLNTSAGSILAEKFPTIASKLFVFVSSDAFSLGPGSNTEEMRELQELQRALYGFLHVMATHGLSSVFLAPNCRGYLDAIVQLLLLSSCSHKDKNIRKMCIQIFIKLIKDWCTKSNGEDKVPGFRSFIIEKFATNCCLHSVLDKSFEFRDGETLVLFGEIVAAQRFMYEKFDDDFIVCFVSKGLSAAHCPQHLAEAYSEKLRGNDIKAFKSFYQSLIENLRQQENGSLDFR